MLMWHVSIGCFVRFDNICINHPVITVKPADCALSCERHMAHSGAHMCCLGPMACRHVSNGCNPNGEVAI
jgi:hypothetical protein